MRRCGSLLLTFALVPMLACSDRPAAAPQPAKGGGGDLRVIVQAQPVSLNPNIGTDETSLVIGRNIFNQLVAIDHDHNIIADLAERWDVSHDGRAYTFHLADNVRWHDGQPLTSDDVKWTFEALARGEGWGHDVASRIVGIDTPDAHTVVFHLETPWAPFLAELASWGTFVLPRHAYGGADWRDSPANNRPIGSGPFVFSEWKTNGPVVLAANRQYFRPGPFVDRLIFMPMSPARLEEALLKGDAEYAVARPSRRAVAAFEREHLVVRTAPSDSRYYCAFNVRRPPFDDVRVRRAISVAIDRLRLVDDALGGYGAPAFTFYTPMIEWAHNPDARVGSVDDEAARAWLDEAGLRPDARGVRLEASLLVGDLSPFDLLARDLHDQLRPIGVSLRVELVPMDEWSRRVLVAHDFDLALLGGSQGPDPDALRTRFGSPSFMGYVNPAFDRTVEQAARIQDPAVRARAYFRAQEMLARDQPAVPLAEAVRVSVYSRRLTGLPQAEARGLVAPYDFSLVRLQK